MLELGSVTKEDIYNNNFSNKLDGLIDDYSNENDKPRDSIKVILYNTNFDSSYIQLLEEVGFKQVFDYEGNSSHTYTMVLLVKDL